MGQEPASRLTISLIIIIIYYLFIYFYSIAI